MAFKLRNVVCTQIEIIAMKWIFAFYGNERQDMNLCSDSEQTLSKYNGIGISSRRLLEGIGADLIIPPGVGGSRSLGSHAGVQVLSEIKKMFIRLLRLAI